MEKLIRDAFGGIIPQTQNDDGTFSVLANGDISNIDFGKYKLLRDAFGGVLPQQYFDVQQKEFVPGTLESSPPGTIITADQLAFQGPPEMSATNVQDAIIESFQLGDSVKQRLIPILSQIDDNLAIWSGSTWEEIFDELNYVSYGRTYDGLTSPSTNQEPFKVARYESNTERDMWYVQVNEDFGFTPRRIEIRAYSTEGNRYQTKADTNNLYVFFTMNNGESLGSAYHLRLNTPNSYMDKNGFKLPFPTTNVQVTYTVYENP
jgi:hypothetical protein